VPLSPRSAWPGMPGFLYFAPTLLQDAGFSAMQTATMATVVLGTAKFLATVLAAIFMERYPTPPYPPLFPCFFIYSA
jgi:hypothetical protein